MYAGNLLALPRPVISWSEFISKGSLRTHMLARVPVPFFLQGRSVPLPRDIMPYCSDAYATLRCARFHAFDFVFAGDGSQTRSFQYVDDLVRGLIALMNSKYSGPVNIGNPDEYTVKDFAQVGPSVTVCGRPEPRLHPSGRSLLLSFFSFHSDGKRVIARVICHSLRVFLTRVMRVTHS